MTVAQRIETKLNQAFAPESLEVIDESDRHKGHSGARPEGETHFRIVMISTAFEGMGRIARQRMVNKTLKVELDGPVHALSMSALTPAEAQAAD